MPLESKNLSLMVSTWEDTFLISQAAAIAQFNADINPGTSLPYVPPRAPYSVVESYVDNIDGVLQVPSPSILGDAIQQFMVSAFSTFGV